MMGPADGSRSRLLLSAKSLFAKLGYEQTSTSAVARDAGTSESQLVRYFGSKAGLLEAIFDDAWRPVNAQIHDMLADAGSGRDAVAGVLTTVLGALDRDDELATIFLFEGRRIRQDSEVRMSSGFMEFADVVHRLIRRGQKDGSFSAAFDALAVSAALIGAAEGMVRERLLSRRAGKARPFPDRQVHRVFEAMLDAVAPK